MVEREFKFIGAKSHNLSGARVSSLTGNQAGGHQDAYKLVVVVPDRPLRGTLRFEAGSRRVTLVRNFRINQPPIVTSISPTTIKSNTLVTLRGTDLDLFGYSSNCKKWKIGSLTFEMCKQGAASYDRVVMRPGTYFNQGGRILKAVPGKFVGRVKIPLGNLGEPSTSPPQSVTLEPLHRFELNHFWITDYVGKRRIIKNIGILDGSTLAYQDSNAGIFVVEGHSFDSNATVSVGTETARIISRKKSGQFDQITAKVNRVPDNAFVSVSSGGQSDTLRPVHRLTYTRVESAFLTSLVRDATIRIRNGEMTVNALGRTETSSVSNNSLVNIPNRVRIGGRINNADSQSVSAHFTNEGGSSRAAVNLDVRFSGNLGFSGSAQIFGYGCGSFRVARQECSGIDIPCFTRKLGQALRSAVTCLNPGNWGPRNWSVPVNGSFNINQIVVKGTMTPSGAGLRGTQNTVNVSATFTIPQIPNYRWLPLNSLKNGVIGMVEGAISRAMGNVRIAQQTATSINALLGSQGRVLGLYVNASNRDLFVDKNLSR